MSKYGVFVQELATSFAPPVTASAAMPVFIGTAPVHKTANPAAAVSKPVLVYSYPEAVAALGYSDDWETWTLCEAMYTQFRLYGVAPAVFINVFDPDKSLITGSSEEIPIINGKITIANDLAVLDTLTVKASEDGSALTLGEDFKAEYADEGGITIVPIRGGELFGETSAYVEYKTVDPSAVTPSTVLGGVSASTGKRTGIELVDEVFPRTRLVPGNLAAPGWDHDPEVAFALWAKAQNINGCFKAMSVVDFPETAGAFYREIPAWKERNGYTSEFNIPCWPRDTLGSRVIHKSLTTIGVMGRTDSENGDVPFMSPSNHKIEVDGMTWLGEEVWLDPQQTEYLVNNGIMTGLNWIGGWRAAGNSTAIYPFSTDPKDRWIPIRRMFNWMNNRIILTYWSRVSLPIRGVLLDDIVTSLNGDFNGLVGDGVLLGGRVEWFSTENQYTTIMDGKIQFHVYMAPPPPAQEIRFVMEYDPGYFASLAAIKSGMEG